MEKQNVVIALLIVVVLIAALQSVVLFGMSSETDKVKQLVDSQTNLANQGQGETYEEMMQRMHGTTSPQQQQQGSPQQGTQGLGGC